MPIHIGSNPVSRIYIGNTIIQRIYIGSDLIYQNGLIYASWIKNPNRAVLGFMSLDDGSQTRLYTYNEFISKPRSMSYIDGTLYIFSFGAQWTVGFSDNSQVSLTPSIGAAASNIVQSEEDGLYYVAIGTRIYEIDLTNFTLGLRLGTPLNGGSLQLVRSGDNIYAFHRNSRRFATIRTDPYQRILNVNRTGVVVDGAASLNNTVYVSRGTNLYTFDTNTGATTELFSDVSETGEYYAIAAIE